MLLARRLFVYIVEVKAALRALELRDLLRVQISRLPLRWHAKVVLNVHVELTKGQPSGGRARDALGCGLLAQDGGLRSVDAIKSRVAPLV